MAERVASQTYFRAPSLAAPTPDLERLRSQVTDFEQLVEAMIKQNEQLKKELRDVKAERDNLKVENERLRNG